MSNAAIDELCKDVDFLAGKIEDLEERLDAREVLIKKLVADNADLNQKLQDLMADADIFDTIKQAKTSTAMGWPNGHTTYKHPVVTSPAFDVNMSEEMYERYKKFVEGEEK